MFVDVNGSIVPHERQKLPLAGPPTGLPNGVYETMRIYAGARRPFLLRQHIARLDLAARFLGVRCSVKGDDWESRIRAVLEANDLLGIDARVRITLFREPTETRPRDTVAAWQLDHGNLVRKQTRGVTAIVASTRRKQGAELFQHKTLALRGTQIAQEEAASRGADEALSLNEHDEICEATYSNVFAVIDGKLLTPPVASPCLPGVTRAVIREIAAEEGLEVLEQALPYSHLARATEVFLTSSVSEIIPVVGLEGLPAAQSEAGPVTRLLQTRYRDWVLALR